MKNMPQLRTRARLAALALALAGVGVACAADLDPLDMRRTFGAHEPYTM